MRAISEVAAGVDPAEANERADDVVIGRDDFEHAIERIEPSA